MNFLTKKKGTSEFKTSIYHTVFISYWHEGSRVLCGKKVTNKPPVWQSTHVVKGAVKDVFIPLMAIWMSQGVYMDSEALDDSSAKSK